MYMPSYMLNKQTDINISSVIWKKTDILKKNFVKMFHTFQRFLSFGLAYWIGCHVKASSYDHAKCHLKCAL